MQYQSTLDTEWGQIIIDADEEGILSSLSCHVTE